MELDFFDVIGILPHKFGEYYSISHVIYNTWSMVYYVFKMIQPVERISAEDDSLTMRYFFNA